MSRWNNINGYLIIKINTADKNKRECLSFLNELKALFKTDNELLLSPNYEEWSLKENVVPYGSEGCIDVVFNFKKDNVWGKYCIFILIHGNLRDSDKEQEKYIKKWCKELKNKIDVIYTERWRNIQGIIRVNNKKIIDFSR